MWWMSITAFINGMHKGGSMKRWRGTLVVSYTQEIEVNADTKAEAEDLMRDAFDPTRCYNTAECQAYDVEEMEVTK